MNENDITPEMLKQWIALGVAPDEQKLMYEEMGLGTGMSQVPGAQGSTVGPYHMYVAASPLEHMATALQRYMGLRQQKNATQGLRDSFGQQTAARNDYAAALLRALRPQEPMGPYQGQAPQLIE